MKGLLVLSGGADSATLAYWLKDRGDELTALSFDYGQRHRKELASAAAIAKELGVSHEVIDLRGLTKFLKGSALTDGGVAVPHGHYEAESMRLTVVPNRNTIMLSIAWGAACAAGLDYVALGVHAGDHYIYPDCRPEYVKEIEVALRSGTDGHRKPDMALLTPFIDKTKADIIAIGLLLGVPYDKTWTCYEGGDKPCGKCGSCGERAEAFAKAGGTDALTLIAA
jgi:7-cyano-7-deazaguanine synthase